MTVRTGTKTRRPKAAYTPTKTLNSAPNPTSQGRPRDARKETIMKVATRGARFAIPPSSEMFRVPIMWPRDPATMKRAADTRPWANIWKIAPEKPRTAPRPYPPPALKPYTPAAMPRVTKPMWLTLEKATRRFRSSWAMHTKAPYRIEMMPTRARSQYRSTAAVGSICTLNRMRPYPPSLSRTPARITDAPVGASTWASGSHVCRGHVGNFVPKAMRSPTNARSASGPGGLGRVEVITVMSNVCGVEYRENAKTATRRGSEARNVYRKNLNAAYLRRGPPQTAIRKYIGTRPTSQKTRNWNRSKERNTPLIVVSMKRNIAKNSGTRVFSSQEIARARGVSRAFRKIRTTDSSSAPRK